MSCLSLTSASLSLLYGHDDKPFLQVFRQDCNKSCISLEPIGIPWMGQTWSKVRLRLAEGEESLGSTAGMSALAATGAASVCRPA